VSLSNRPFAWATEGAKRPTRSADCKAGFSRFDADADTRDGVHPNDGASAKIAANWDKEALGKLARFTFPFWSTGYDAGAARHPRCVALPAHQGKTRVSFLVTI
jgi:hypothetical protein